MADFVVLGPT